MCKKLTFADLHTFAKCPRFCLSPGMIVNEWAERFATLVALFLLGVFFWFCELLCEVWMGFTYSFTIFDTFFPADGIIVWVLWRSSFCQEFFCYFFVMHVCCEYITYQFVFSVLTICSWVEICQVCMKVLYNFFSLLRAYKIISFESDYSMCNKIALKHSHQSFCCCGL